MLKSAVGCEIIVKTAPTERSATANSTGQLTGAKLIYTLTGRENYAYQ